MSRERIEIDLFCLKDKMRKNSKFVNKIRKFRGLVVSSDSYSSSDSDEILVMSESQSCKHIKWSENNMFKNASGQSNYNDSSFEYESSFESEGSDDDHTDTESYDSLNNAFSADLDRTHMFPILEAKLELVKEMVNLIRPEISKKYKNISIYNN